MAQTIAARSQFAVGLMTLTLLGCDSSRRADHTLVVISPHREEIRQEVAAGFTRWLQEKPEWHGKQVRVEWRDIGGGTSQIVRYLRTRYKETPDSVGIDILFGGGTDIYLDFKHDPDFKHESRLEGYAMPPELRLKIRQNLRGVDLYDGDGFWDGALLDSLSGFNPQIGLARLAGLRVATHRAAWHGVMISSLGILYDRKHLDQIGLAGWSPRRWQDLADERLVGRVTAADPRMTGVAHMLYELIVQTYGWDEGFRQLMRTGANARGFARFSDTVVKDVVFGRAAVGGSLDSYGFSAVSREQHDVEAGLADGVRLGFVLPRDETVLNPDSIAILKGAPHRDLARKFVEYNLSEEGGQRLWMLKPGTLPGGPERYRICRLSVMDALYDAVRYPLAIRSTQINPFDDRALGNPVPYNNRKANERWNALNDLIGAWIIDPHDALAAAWRAVLNVPQGPRREALEAELFEPPCSEGELRTIAERLRRGPRERAELLSRWQGEARSRYHRVRLAAR